MYTQSQRDLLRELVVSEYKLKDQSTFFGFIWTVAHPLLLLLVMFIVFNNWLGAEIEHYAVFLLIGLVHYTHFATTTTCALRALRQMRQLTTEAVFPKELLVLSTIGAGTLEFFVSLLFCLLLAAFTGVPITLAWLWLPAVAVLQLTLVVWVSLLLATVYPFAGDLDHIYEILLRVMMFATPIFYEAEFLKDKVAEIVLLANPLTWMVEFTRQAVIHGNVPTTGPLVFLLANLVLGWFAYRFFKFVEPWFAQNV